ncbi:MAG: hypothetical protein Q9221_006325 [Calogaya cf. arnoldii]
MADVNCDRLSGLAPELRDIISELISESFTKNDLKKLRRVPKRWNECATPMLFSELTFRMHMTPAEWAKRVEFKMGAFVKTLYVTTIEFEDMDYEEYQTDNWVDASCPLRSPQHLQQGFATQESSVKIIWRCWQHDIVCPT